MIADTPEKIAAYQLLVLKSMLKLESLGMKHSKLRGGAAQIVRRIIGSKTRDKFHLLSEYENYLRNQGIL